MLSLNRGGFEIELMPGQFVDIYFFCFINLLNQEFIF
jgi:hypothetical protein